MKAHMEKVRNHLGELGGLASKTESAERKILSSAEKRLATVQSEIDRATPGIESAGDEAHERYLDLVTERGQLNVVIAKSRQALA